MLSHNGSIKWARVLIPFICMVGLISPSHTFAQGRKAKIYDLGVWQSNIPEQQQPGDSLAPDAIKSLEEFTGPDDAVVYIYRLPAVLGAAVKWQVQWNHVLKGKLRQNDCVLVHVDTKIPVQVFTLSGYEAKYEFGNILPEHHYFIEVKGMYMTFGPMNNVALERINSCTILQAEGK